MLSSLNRVEINRSALRHNFRVCREKAGNAELMPMIKADAYGHGMIECAAVFAGEGAAAFGVAEAVEGVALREAGFDQPIFVIVGMLPESIAAVIEYGLTPVVVDGNILPELSQYAQKQGYDVGLHVKMDAGMGRQGCLPDDMPLLIKQIEELPALHLAGIMAHFPMADDLRSPNTRKVLATFNTVVRGLGGQVPSDCTLHIANSGGLFHFEKTCLSMVRPGIALYGCYPEGSLHEHGEGQTRLDPVMRFMTKIIQVRTVPPGAGLGYGQTFVTQRPTRLAVLPTGYEDGYLRSLSNRAEVLIHGHRFPVVGRVSMNLTLVDITDGVDTIRPGDEVVLLGRQGDEEITADEIAGWMDTISYEVLCLFGNLNTRYYTD